MYLGHFEALVTIGQERGEFRTDYSAATLSAYINRLLFGLVVVSWIGRVTPGIREEDALMNLIIELYCRAGVQQHADTSRLAPLHRNPQGGMRGLATPLRRRRARTAKTGRRPSRSRFISRPIPEPQAHPRHGLHGGPNQRKSK